MAPVSLQPCIPLSIKYHHLQFQINILPLNEFISLLYFIMFSFLLFLIIFFFFKETDIIVAALTMTSEREEVIDFVAPYFEQSGLLIGK